ncbi:hypothetical protein AB5I39_00995 [Sphingomonas sp. MMS24-J45]|uniref:hypothetical protein n=1 Tax=Sphingomonas sp. MMS24-J45 TaxID=3238806 RepID=UPI00384FD0FB
MGLGPFDLPGGAFLALYGVFFVATIVAGLAIPCWLRPEGEPPGSPTRTNWRISRAGRRG